VPRVGAAIWFSPLALSSNTKAALAISAMMIIAWMTEVMEYALPVWSGCSCSGSLASPSRKWFQRLRHDASWFYIGAVFLGTMATKTAAAAHRRFRGEPRRSDL